jgi:hypothetical protein
MENLRKKAPRGAKYLQIPVAFLGLLGYNGKKQNTGGAK